MFYFLEDFHYANYADDSTRYNEDKCTGFIVTIGNFGDRNV